MNATLLRQLRDSAIELGDRLSELLLPDLMRRDLELALQLRPRQTAGLELAHTFGVTALCNLAGFLLFVFPFFHALGEAGFRVDESFSGITHDFDYTDRLAGAFTRPV